MGEQAKVQHDGRRLGERVYEMVRDAIIEGEFPPDNQLVQESIAERFGVSRTPVRDALNRLALEGLVTWIPGYGYIVNDLTEQNIEDVYQIRQALETLAARLACGRHTSADLARLGALIDEMAAEDVFASTRHFDLNRRFHAALIAPCRNQLLNTMIDQLWDHPLNRRIAKVYIKNQDAVSQMVSQHRAILDAARTRDEALLIRLVSEHIFVSNEDMGPSR